MPSSITITRSLIPAALGFLIEKLQGFFDGLVRKPEGAVVHRNHPAGFQIKECLRGIGGVGMDVAKLFRIVSPDRQQSEFGSEPASDFAES